MKGTPLKCCHDPEVPTSSWRNNCHFGYLGVHETGTNSVNLGVVPKKEYSILAYSLKIAVASAIFLEQHLTTGCPTIYNSLFMLICTWLYFINLFTNNSISPFQALPLLKVSSHISILLTSGNHFSLYVRPLVQLV